MARKGIVQVLRTLDPDGTTSPRLAIAAFAVMAAVDLAGVLSTERVDEGWIRYVVAMSVVATTTTVAWVSSRVSMPDAMSLGAPCVNLLAVALASTYEPSHFGLAVALPAVWVGLNFGFRGARYVLIFASFGAVIIVVSQGFAGIQSAALYWLAAVFVSSPGATAALSFRRQANRLLRTRRAKEAVIDSVDVGILRVDANARVLERNPRQEEFHALMHPQGVDGPMAVFADDGVTPLAAEDQPVARALATGDFHHVLIWAGVEPEEPKALSVSARRMYDEHGRLEGAVLAFHDVTRLIRALQVKDDFVSSVSHELRTPLTSIVGYLKLVQEEHALQPQVVDHLARVERNANRLHRLVEDLLATATEASDNLQLLPIDLADIVPAVLETLEQRARLEGIQLVPKLSPAPMLGDAQRIEQVIENLTSNAVKYSEPGGGVLVETSSVGDRAVLRVTDTGIGMSATEVEGLFTRFFRAESARRSGIGGVGLGLVIARDIARAHGGDISVASEAGRGSVFEVSFPRADMPVSDA